MYPAGQHPLFPYSEEEKLTVLQNVGITEAQLKNDVNSIKEWVQKQPHLAEAGINSNAAAFHLLMSKGSVERVKQKIDYFYSIRAKSTSDLHDITELLTHQHRALFHTHVTASAPKLFNGSRVSCTKVFDWNKFKMEYVVLNLAIIGDIRYANDFSSGETWIIDVDHAPLGQIMKLNFLALARTLRIIRETLGMKIIVIHIINCGMSTTVQAVLNICKQVTSKKILDRITFHDSLESLHEVLPKEYIFEDYGGYLPSAEVFRDKMEKLFAEEKTKQFLLDCCKVVADLSKKPITEYDEDNLPGNFKKLELD